MTKEQFWKIIDKAEEGSHIEIVCDNEMAYQFDKNMPSSNLILESTIDPLEIFVVCKPYSEAALRKRATLQLVFIEYGMVQAVRVSVLHIDSKDKPDGTHTWGILDNFITCTVDIFEKIKIIINQSR